MRLADGRSWLTFPRFAAFTTALTLTLVMLGIYTAATGSGLACSAQWPLCDNGLLPQTVPSFIEWFHRLVAMITGFFIVGTALWAWRRPGRRVQTAATLAVVLLPLQISIGAVTVTLNGALPSGYSVPTHAAHLLAALAIFTSLVCATLFPEARDEEPIDRVRRALPVALGGLAVAALFSRVVLAVPYTPAAQAVFYGVALALYALLVAATYWLGGTPFARLRALTGSSVVLVFVAMLLGRDLVYYTPAVRLLNAAVVLLAAVLLAAATWLVRRAPETDRPGGTAAGD